MKVISDILALKKGKTYVYYDSAMYEKRQLISQCDMPGPEGEEVCELRKNIMALYESGHCIPLQEKLPDDTFLYKVIRT